MNESPELNRAVELLQDLGLKEYESKAFVALARLPRGTAKDISEISDVPRTRVYDATRVLESKGLVEITHSNPQQFRAVSIDEAIATVRDEYETRIETLQGTLADIEQMSVEDEEELSQEVWSLSGRTGVANRTQKLVTDADEEVVMVVGHESIFSDRLSTRLETARERGVEVILGAIDESLRGEIDRELPDVEVFVSGLEWLDHSSHPEDDTDIGRLLLVDREAILVSTFHDTGTDAARDEQAVFGLGFDNGLVTIVRRLMTTGLLPRPATETD